MSQESKDKPKSLIKKIQRRRPHAQAHGRLLQGAGRGGQDRRRPRSPGAPAWARPSCCASFGFLVYFPENHGAMLGSSRMAADLIPAANAVGYSPDICSYLTSDVGSYLQKKTPLTKAFGMEGVPKPDVLVYNTNQCRDVQDWFAFYQREFEVPLIGIETPRGIGEVTRSHLDGLVGQHKALIPDAGGGLGREVRHGPAARRSVGLVLPLHRAVEEGAAAGRAPGPRRSPSSTAPSTWGRRWCCAATSGPRRYYETLIAELEQRVDRGRGRRGRRGPALLLGGHAGLGQAARPRRALRQPPGLRGGLHLLQQLDLRGPGRRRSLRGHGPGLHRAVHRPLRGLQGAVPRRRWSGTTASTASSTTTPRPAPTTPTTATACPSGCASSSSIPHVVINGDLNDLRLYSEEQARTQFEALVEQLRS